MLVRRRIASSLEASAYISKAWNKGPAASKSRSFQSSSKPMGSMGLTHGTSPPLSSDFIYDGSKNGTPGNNSGNRTTPFVEVPISHPAPPKLPVLSTPEKKAPLEAQDKRFYLAAVPAYHRGLKYDRIPYWQKIPRWKDVEEKDFLSYRWNVSCELFFKRVYCFLTLEIGCK